MYTNIVHTHLNRYKQMLSDVQNVSSKPNKYQYCHSEPVEESVSQVMVKDGCFGYAQHDNAKAPLILDATYLVHSPDSLVRAPSKSHFEQRTSRYCHAEAAAEASFRSVYAGKIPQLRPRNDIFYDFDGALTTFVYIPKVL